MAFNNDVGGTKLFGQIYELVMGKQSDGFTVLEVTYSIGLTFGILVFLIILVKTIYSRSDSDGGADASL